jgi:hypothetical protein
MRVQVRDLPAFHVAYMRYVGPYGAHGIPALWTRLAGGWSHAALRLRVA